jgi:16S rRNA (guanine966-N2)-methyltransferase
MGDRIRGALFNTLGDIQDLTVLDAFAGTGALGFEAISRGARSTLLIEHDTSAQKTIADNIALLDVHGQVQLVRANCSSWSDNNPNELFDIVLLDPPYDAVTISLLEKMVQHTAQDGIVVLSLPGDTSIPEFVDIKNQTVSLQVVSHKLYGDAQLIFYRRSH